ncbi:hypothetical protein CMQ_4057 [Grosmannia clavigera kw1407]|uniref:Glycosyltransferase 2 n=1 Tax=Grosmannia clavigera (strain kw1407 / UAMH 11150) TaxID=655863 RepID=F0XA98_GROCL|nr:uncharacterized protein CMQ_4057 [Grosmannia clavigera kw1407]EFX05988.1 hypothetical protein CMQ_4057 [Grosmannia clavigera kw1407]
MQSLFLSDVELGKKDDDHKTSKGGVSSVRMLVPTAARVHPRKFLKRLLFATIAGFVIYTFIRNIPSDVGVRDRRRPVYGQPATGFSAGAQVPLSEQDGDETRTGADGEDISVFTYNGPIDRLSRLFPSLRTLGSTRSSLLVNKHVLFVAASLKSTTALLPIACQMGSELRNHVQFAVVGRNEIDIEELEQMNGIDDSCRITFHGMSLLCSSPGNIELYMHPQVIVVDGTPAEELFLKRALAVYVKRAPTTIIELPEDGAKRFGWIAKLDSVSLTNWNSFSIDILIQAVPGASGSLIRLLKSLSRADFGSRAVPHLTIELPQKIDLPTQEYLATFQWPPLPEGDPPASRQLSLRHRIVSHGINERDSSVRFLESFWPADPKKSHVLVLSPQAELSEDFFHYVTYTLLEYRYSGLPKIEKQLFGISLELPSTAIDGTKFSPPTSLYGKGRSDREGSVPFLWQAPNSNAALFLGERWADLHGFVSELLTRQPAVGADGQPQPKLANKMFPSWLEYALQLCQARGYWMLYPSGTTAGALATIHNELYRPPEEYEKDVVSETEDDPTGGKILHGGGVADTEEASLGPSATLLDVLPETGGLPSFVELPLLTWEGKQATLRDVDVQAAEYARNLQLTVGGCAATELKNLPLGTLFCEQDA